MKQLLNRVRVTQ